MTLRDARPPKPSRCAAAIGASAGAVTRDGPVRDFATTLAPRSTAVVNQGRLC